jgi:hypothetical protein
MTDAITGEIVIDVAEKINLEYHLAKDMAVDWIGHVINCGQFLIEQKEKTEHGDWLGWVLQYCDFSDREAERYMRIASNSTRVSNLEGIDSVRGVLRLLAEPSDLKGTGVEEKPLQIKLFKDRWVSALAVLRNYPELVDICEEIEKMLAKRKDQ